MEIAIGIDIGGTSTKIALVNFSGEILAKKSFPSHSTGGADAFFPNLLHAISELLRIPEMEFSLGGIGVGAPSGNEISGTIEGAANLPFRKPFPIVQLLEENYDVPVRLTKDSNAALLGESRYGSARGIQHFILITVGTGLGSSIMANGRIVKGGSGLAGEAGHIRVANNQRKCACGKTGCLETYVSAVGLRRTAMALMAEEIIASPLRNYAYDQLNATLIYETAVQGDRLARMVFELTGTILGGKMAELVAIFEPEAIVLAGGVAAAGDLLIAPMQTQMEKDLLVFHKNKVRILNTSLATNEAALLGAASLVWDQEKFVPVS